MRKARTLTKSIVLIIGAALLIVIGSAGNTAAANIVLNVTTDADTLVFSLHDAIRYNIGDQFGIVNLSDDSIYVQIANENGTITFQAPLYPGNSYWLHLSSANYSSRRLCVTYTAPGKNPIIEKCLPFSHNVRTLSEWGIIALIVVLIGVGVTVAFRRRTVRVV